VVSGGEAGLQEVSAGGGFPVDHFACDEDAGEFFNHEVFIELIPADSSGGGNGFGDRAGSGEGDVAVFDFVGELGGSFPGTSVRHVFEDGAGGGVEFESAASLADEVALDVTQAGA